MLTPIGNGISRKTLLKSLLSVVAACALLGTANAWAQTTCDLIADMAELGINEEVIEHKTDFSDGDCTTQVIVKVDMSGNVTKVGLKIDQSCASTGQTQFTGTLIVPPVDPPPLICTVDYDNPANPTGAVEEVLIADVPGLSELLLDAAEATAMQFEPGTDELADALVATLTMAAGTVCPCWPGGAAGLADAVLNGTYSQQGEVVEVAQCLYEPGSPTTFWTIKLNPTRAVHFLQTGLSVRPNQHQCNSADFNLPLVGWPNTGQIKPITPEVLAVCIDDVRTVCEDVVEMPLPAPPPLP